MKLPSPRALLREFVCDVVIFLYKIGESLMDTTIRPYIISAVCSDMFYKPPTGQEYWSVWGDQQTNGIGGGGVGGTGGVSARGVDFQSLLKAQGGGNDTDGEAVCYHLEDLPEIGDEVQRHAAGVLVAYRVLLNVPAVILGLFCGAWSDTRGRKLPMMAPSVGSCLAVVIYLASTQVHHVKVALLLVGSAIQGIFGKTAFIAMAVNSHVSDTSDTDQRTKRLGRVLASSFIGMFLGSLLAGVLQDLSSLNTTLVVVSACHALCVITVLLGVTDTVSCDVSEDDRDFIIAKGDVTPSSSSSEGLDCAGTEVDKGKECGGGEEEGEGERARRRKHPPGLFSWVGLKNSVMAVVRKREGNKRSVVVICLVALTLNQCLKVGDQDITVLFVEQPPLSWPNSRYGYLIAVDYGTMGVALLALLPVMSETFHMTDITIVMIAMFFKLVRALWAGFCTETWMVFTSVISGALGGLLNPGLRSVMSKTCHTGEVGKLFSIQASLETLSKLVGSSVFTGIYAATVNTFPAAAYLVEAFIYVGLLVLFLWLAQLIKEDGVFGLFVSFKPYSAMEENKERERGSESGTVWYGTIPTIRTEDHDEEKSIKGTKVKTKNMFPLGASTP